MLDIFSHGPSISGANTDNPSRLEWTSAVAFAPLDRGPIAYCNTVRCLIRAKPNATQANKRMPRDNRMTFFGNEARKIYVNVIGLTIFPR